ncbi:MAG: hypothetical protein HOV80_05050 [Polyangiaceae bacterium]|nr:hypothetical protein [Polyangiaceae bacterium]
MAVGTDGRIWRAFSIALTAHTCALLIISVVPGVVRRTLLPMTDLTSVEIDAPEPVMKPPAPAADRLAAAAAGADTATRTPRGARRSAAMPKGEPYVDDGASAPGPGAPDGANDWSEPVAPSDSTFQLPLGLTWEARIEDAPPAPVRPPKARPVSPDAANNALGSARRDLDRKLGMGNPEETIVSTAVATAGRALAVPKDTRFRIEVGLDRNGRVTGVKVATASAGDVGTWDGLVAAVKASLGDAIQVGPDVQQSGGVVVIDATIKHVFVSGSDRAAIEGACPTDPHTSGMWDAVPFGWTGGAAYGQPATGSCMLSDVTNGQPKQITVRMKTTTVLHGNVPPPAASFGPAKKPPKIPSIWDMIF